MVRCEVIHDGEIFPNHRVLTMLAGRLGLRRGLRFFPGISSDTLTNRKWLCDYLIYLEMNYREYQIYSSQTFSSNQSAFANLKFNGCFANLQTGRASPANQWNQSAPKHPEWDVVIVAIFGHIIQPRCYSSRLGSSRPSSYLCGETCIPFLNHDQKAGYRLHLGTRAGNGIRFARGMLGSWQDNLEPGRDTGPVL
jgi:hypothetical protein